MQFLDDSKLKGCCDWQDYCRLNHICNRDMQCRSPCGIVIETELAIAQQRYAVEQEIENLYKTSEQLFQEQQS